jgi:hypothetical protein
MTCDFSSVGREEGNISLEGQIVPKRALPIRYRRGCLPQVKKRWMK